MTIFSHLQVLVLDRDPMFCVLLKDSMNLLGFDWVNTVTLPEAAMVLLAHERHDIVLVECAPCHDPLWTALEEAASPRPVMLAMSFDRDIRTRLRALRQGADGFIEKDMARSALEQTIVRVLKSEAGRRNRLVLLPTAQV